MRYRLELDAQAVDPAVLAYLEPLPLRPTGLRLLLALADAAPRVVPLADLWGLIGETEPQQVYWHLCHLRALLPPGAVLTVPRRGYALTLPVLRHGALLPPPSRN